MKALILDAPQQLRVGDWPAPRCGPGDGILRPIAAGICAGDMQRYAGRNPYTMYPLVCGHEVCGDVIEVGSDATCTKKGDLAGRGLRPLPSLPARKAELLHELLPDRIAQARLRSNHPCGRL